MTNSFVFWVLEKKSYTANFSYRTACFRLLHFCANENQPPFVLYCFVFEFFDLFSGVSIVFYA
jgi:hypothetical protein